MSCESKTMVLEKGNQICLFTPLEKCPTQNLAAAELAKYLKSVLMIDAEIIADKSDNCCFIFESLDDISLGTEGFEISIDTCHVLIRANSSLGFLRGTYYFIEKFLGVRFLSPDKEFIPELPRLALPVKNIREVPAIAYRGATPCMKNSFSTEKFLTYIEWMGKNRLNYLGFGYLDDAERLRKLRPELVKRGIFLNIGGHILEAMLYGNWKIDTSDGYEKRDKVAESTFRQHPEWHCLIKGKRAVCKDHYAHICLSSQEAISVVKKNILLFLREYNDIIDVFSFCLNDSLAAFCECDMCRKHNVATLTQNFYNQIAETVRSEFSDLPIHFCVYSDYILPDLKVKPGKNVCFELAFWGQDYRMGLAGDSEKNHRGEKLYKQWKKLMADGEGNNEVFAFQYYCYSRYSPGLRLRCLFEDARFYRDQGISGCYDNLGCFVTIGEGFPRSLTHYFMARALWNPDLNPLKVAYETLKPVFKEDTEAVISCIKLWDDMDADILTEPIWWRWRQYPLNLLDDAIKTAALNLSSLKESENILKNIRPKDDVPLLDFIVSSWLNFTKETISKVEKVKGQKLLLRELIHRIESKKDLNAPDFMAELKTRNAAMFAKSKKAGLKFNKDECTLLSRTFMLPEYLAILIASFGRGKERALANVSYNALYDWGGCRHAKKLGISCEDCDIIACPGYLSGPGMKRYTVRELPSNSEAVSENRWIYSDK